MSAWLDKIIDKIRDLSNSIDKYKKDTIIQSLPALTYVNRAKKLIEQNDYEGAEKILSEALELPQPDGLVYKYLGVVYERKGENELAIENYQKAADLTPQDKIVCKRLGFCLLTAGKFEQAEKAFEKASKIHGNVSETFTEWGMALFKQNKYSEALEKFTIAVNINRYNFSAVFLGAVTEIKLGMYDRAEAKLSFLANVSPNDGNNFEYARLKAIKNDYVNAVHYAQKALEYNPKLLPAYILLGQVYAELSDKENALKSFETAYEKELISSVLLLEWGKVLQKFGKYDEALEKLEKAYEITPENPDIYAALGLCYVVKKEFDKAEPLLQKASKQDSENKQVNRALGIISYEKGETDKAVSLLRGDDEDAVNCFYLAKCFERQKNDTRTKDYYETCLRLNPQYTSAYIDYVKYLISKGNFADARRKLRKALKNESDNTVLLNLMFKVSYILVKDNIYEYNVKEVLAVAEKIESISTDLFEYPAEKQELISLLREREKN